MKSSDTPNTTQPAMELPALPELLPCPFCGGEPRAFVRQDESIWSHDAVTWTHITCDECGCASEDTCEGDEFTAHEKWNRRASASSAAVGEPVAWLVSIPEEPELGEWFSEEDMSSAGYISKPLYLGATPPSAQQEGGA